MPQEVQQTAGARLDRMRVMDRAQSADSVAAGATSFAQIDRHVSDLRATYGTRGGVDLLEPMITHEFPGRIALASSFGAEAAVLLDLVAQVSPATPVIFIDTGKLFEETYNYFYTLTRHLGLTDVYIATPDASHLQDRDPKGTLWQSNPDACCDLRKVEPMMQALAGYDAWITGRKRFHGGTRQNLETIESVDGRIKINPLADWSQDQIDRAFKDRHLPAHPLVAQGYSSIGCHHCTHRAEGPGVRSGRWADSGKTECGIHRAKWAQNPSPPHLSTGPAS